MKQTIYGNQQIIPARDGFDLVTTITGDTGPDEVTFEPIVCWVVIPCSYDDADDVTDPILRPVVASGMIPSDPDWAIRTPDRKIHFIEDCTVDSAEKALEVFKERHHKEQELRERKLAKK